MDIEEIWRRFQKHMGYTDAEMKIFRSDPVKVKMVTETPEFTKCRVIAEVIESHGCHAQHKVGDRSVLNPGGQLVTGECPQKDLPFRTGSDQPSYAGNLREADKQIRPQFRAVQHRPVHGCRPGQGRMGKNPDEGICGKNPLRVYFFSY